MKNKKVLPLKPSHISIQESECWSGCPLVNLFVRLSIRPVQKLHFLVVFGLGEILF